MILCIISSKTMNKMVAVVLIRKCLHIKHMFSSFHFDTNLYLYLITLQLHIPRTLHNRQNLHIHSGISTLEGEKWAKHRRLITPTFHHEKLSGMVPEFLASCCNLIDRWKMLVASDGWSEIDINPELQSLSTDVISRAAFGSSYKEGKKIFELQKDHRVLDTSAAAIFTAQCSVNGFKKWIKTCERHTNYTEDQLW
ncbi:unnamed protein product [Coffea canephora]|uniref:Uncharacterized protein n=1 Tax=Coffea canephora TaxID=49390 RepID=A0A068V7E9_COFCA|nr:unnamed protein product [Coffea canephora]